MCKIYCLGKCWEKSTIINEAQIYMVPDFVFAFFMTKMPKESYNTGHHMFWEMMENEQNKYK